MTQTLTLIDISSVQNYLFSSNLLKHNQAASYLVALASSEWVRKHTRDSGGEVIYAAGSNAALIFPNRDSAKAFAGAYTRQLITDAPAMRVVIQHTEFEPGQLVEKFDEAGKALVQAKMQHPIGLPLPGLSVTATCDYTGLPAVKPDDEKRWLSAELACKEQVVLAARKAAADPFRSVLKEHDFVYDFNELGMRGESSYLAVIHIDGNGMGKRKKNIVDKCKGQPDEVFKKRMAGFSKEVVDANNVALKETLEMLVKWIDAQDEHRDQFLVHDEKGTRLKFVPIVTGGDDITLVCDGRLGLSLAAHYLNILKDQLVEGKPYFACAGVAIVGNRFPFRRAYALAEELCRSAKKAIKGLDGRSDGVAMDWHLATSGIDQTLRDVRDREYTIQSDQRKGYLFNRPLFFHEQAQEWQSWAGFKKVMDSFSGDYWSGRRNKLKALREVLREGETATRNYKQVLDLAGFPELSGASDAVESGWHGSTCLYFDAIEVLDLFEDIEQPSSK